MRKLIPSLSSPLFNVAAHLCHVGQSYKLGKRKPHGVTVLRLALSKLVQCCCSCGPWCHCLEACAVQARNIEEGGYGGADVTLRRGVRRCRLFYACYQKAQSSLRKRVCVHYYLRFACVHTSTAVGVTSTFFTGHGTISCFSPHEAAPALSHWNVKSQKENECRRSESRPP